MLNKQEIAVMRIIYELCKKTNDSCIVSVNYLREATPEKYRFTNAEIDSLIKQLEYDGYVECTKSDKKGELVNVITLKQKGKAFQRELVQRRREIVSSVFWRILFASLGAVVALIVNKVLHGL